MTILTDPILTWAVWLLIRWFEAILITKLVVSHNDGPVRIFWAVISVVGFVFIFSYQITPIDNIFVDLGVRIGIGCIAARLAYQRRIRNWLTVEELLEKRLVECQKEERNTRNTQDSGE